MTLQSLLEVLSFDNFVYGKSKGGGKKERVDDQLLKFALQITIRRLL